MLVAAEAEADEALALAAKKAKITEAQVAPDDLTGGRVVERGRLGGEQGKGQRAARKGGGAGSSRAMAGVTRGGWGRACLEGRH